MARRSIAVAERDGGFLHTCWNENGRRMAAASADGSFIQVWDAVTAAAAADSGSAQGLSLTAKWKVPSASLCVSKSLSFCSTISCLSFHFTMPYGP
jgi:hypothetical protein